MPYILGTASGMLTNVTRVIRMSREEKLQMILDLSDRQKLDFSQFV